MAQNLTVSGTVLGDGTGVSGVSITLKDLTNNAQAGSTQTDGNGSYSITGSFEVDANNRVKCRVTASKAHFRIRSKTRTTTATSIVVDFNLDPTLVR